MVSTQKKATASFIGALIIALGAFGFDVILNPNNMMDYSLKVFSFTLIWSMMVSYIGMSAGEILK